MRSEHFGLESHFYQFLAKNFIQNHPLQQKLFNQQSATSKPFQFVFMAWFSISVVDMTFLANDT